MDGTLKLVAKLNENTSFWSWSTRIKNCQGGLIASYSYYGSYLPKSRFCSGYESLGLKFRNSEEDGQIMTINPSIVIIWSLWVYLMTDYP